MALVALGSAVFVVATASAATVDSASRVIQGVLQASDFSVQAQSSGAARRNRFATDDGGVDLARSGGVGGHADSLVDRRLISAFRVVHSRLEPFAAGSRRRSREQESRRSRSTKICSSTEEWLFSVSAWVPVLFVLAALSVHGMGGR